MDRALVTRIATELYNAGGRSPKAMSRRLVVPAVIRELGEGSDVGAGSTTLISELLCELRKQFRAEKEAQAGGAGRSDTAAAGTQPTYPEIRAEFARHLDTSESIMVKLLSAAQHRSDEEHALRQSAADAAARKQQTELEENLSEANADIKAAEIELIEARKCGQASRVRIAELEIEMSARDEALSLSVTQLRDQSAQHEADMRRSAAALTDAESVARDAAVALGTLRGEHTAALSRAAEMSDELYKVRAETNALAITASRVAPLETECEALRVHRASQAVEIIQLRSDLAAALSRAELIDHLTTTLGALGGLNGVVPSEPRDTPPS